MVIFIFDRIENRVGEKENACYQHFLLFPQCFQKPSFSGLLINTESFTPQPALLEKAFENTVHKAENACNQH